MSWEKVDFETAVKDITGGNRKFQGFEYNKEGRFPIIDQGDGLIGGYTDEINVVRRAKEVVVFGDHTKSLKYVDFDFCLGADGVKVLQPYDQLDSKFFYYYLKTINLPKVGYSRHYKFLKNLQIPLPPLPIQQRIAEILDAADALKRKDQELLKKYDELAQATFIDMFGDPVRNEKGWELVSLNNYGTFKNGLNFNSGDTGRVIKYLSVGDFKSKYKIDAIEKLTTIELNTLPSNDYLLIDGDIVFVRSNGNKALVGRCVEVFPNQTSVTFSGFCIRYRLCSKELLSSFLAQLFRNSSFKSLMLSGGRGANIQNINQVILSEIKVPKPDLVKQQKFVKIIGDLELQKDILELQIQDSENLFNSLIQKAFEGELVS